MLVSFPHGHNCSGLNANTDNYNSGQGIKIEARERWRLGMEEVGMCKKQYEDHVREGEIKGM